MTELIKLRDLPGVQRATDLCRSPRNFEYPTGSYTAAEIDEISVKLFGIRAWETFTTDDDPDKDEYEAQFNAARDLWPNSRLYWEAIGWDISDGLGGELISAHLFARQIIATRLDLVDGAKFTPDGTGASNTDEWGDPIEPEQGLATRLQQEAAAFLRNRGQIG
jgi:hypothetical protein